MSSSTSVKPGLELDKVHKTFPDGTTALEEINLSFPEGELTALLGPSGCGKTTLLRIIAGLESASSGTLTLGGSDITAMPAYQRRFGMVFQSFALFPHLSVEDNVAYALSISGVGKSVRRKRALELLDLVKLGPLHARRIGELSGGQKQRVAIARALAQEPKLFLLDEPMSALDAQLREEMQIELRLLQQELGITTIVVTHDQREAMSMADSIVVMSAGRIEQTGSPQAVYTAPGSAFVASFIGKTNLLDGIINGQQVEVAGARLTPSSPPPFINGARVTVGCRPEQTVLHTSQLPGEQLITARVKLVRDIGPVREVYLDADNRQLICEQPSAGATRLRVGDEVQVEMPGTALHVYPQPQVA